MRGFEAEAIKRTRREVGWGQSFRAAAPAEAAAVAARVAAAARSGAAPVVPAGGGRWPFLAGEAIDAAARFCAAAGVPAGAADPLRTHLAARFVARGYPVDRELDAAYLLRMRGRELDVLDDDDFVRLCRDPAALLRRMHPDYAAALLRHAVDAIAAASWSAPAALAGRSPERVARSFRHALSPRARWHLSY